MGLFVPPNPTTSIFTRMQKYWTKKSFFPASKATSHIFSYHSWFGFIASMNVSRLDELPFLLVGYIARPTFHATLLLAVYLCHKEKIQLSWLDFFPLTTVPALMIHQSCGNNSEYFVSKITIPFFG